MKSGTSFFNKSFSLHLLRRFWPLWCLWLAVLILVGPLNLGTILPANYDSTASYVNNLNRLILDSGRIVCCLAVFAGALMAMAMLSWLYNPRTCGLVCSLPLKRETLWCTAFLTGLVPMLAGEVLVFLLLLARFGAVPGVVHAYLRTWLAAAALSTAGFYGFACFCGVLTGNVLILPAVYVVLGLAAGLAEAAVRALLGELVYGYSYGAILLEPLSPIIYVLDKISVVGRSPDGPGPGMLPVYHFQGRGYLTALGAAGLALALLALPILKKRHMESAGETVAVPILRPVFRVCMAAGCGVVGATFLCDEFLSRLLHGRALAAAALVVLCLFAALGFFAAQMLMKRTLRVFSGGWKQLGIICACLCLLLLLAEFDVFDYERRLPAADEIDAVFLGGNELKDPLSIDAYLDFHRAVIANKEQDEALSARSVYSVSMDYVLKNGKHFTRLYHIPMAEELESDPASTPMALQTLNNCPEAILNRAGFGRDYGAENIRDASVTLSLPTGDLNRGWESELHRLTPEEAASLYREGILPDAREGHIARSFVFAGAESERELTNATVQIDLMRELLPTPDGLGYYYDSKGHIYLDVLESSSHTLNWLEEHLGLRPENRHALELADGSAADRPAPAAKAVG